MKVTIKPHLRHYFGLLQQQMECDNPTQVLNYLLMDLKLKGYSLVAEYQYIPQSPQPQPQAQPQSQPQPTLQPLPQDDIPQNEDPVIKRLSAFLEDF